MSSLTGPALQLAGGLEEHNNHSFPLVTVCVLTLFQVRPILCWYVSMPFYQTKSKSHTPLTRAIVENLQMKRRKNKMRYVNPKSPRRSSKTNKSNVRFFSIGVKQRKRDCNNYCSTKTSSPVRPRCSVRRGEGWIDRENERRRVREKKPTA